MGNLKYIYFEHIFIPTRLGIYVMVADKENNDTFYENFHYFYKV